jgi:hypothetical protein
LILLFCGEDAAEVGVEANAEAEEEARVGVGAEVGRDAGAECSEEVDEMSARRMYFRRYFSAWTVAVMVIDGSIFMTQCSGAPGELHRDGKSGPNMGTRAYAILWQKVAHRARAHSKGIQYPVGK